MGGGRGAGGGIPGRAARVGVLEAVSALVELALPLECGGCRRRGTRWCAVCDAELAATAFPGGPRRVRPVPCPGGLPPVWSGRPYAGASAVVQAKDADRRDLIAVLAPLLADSLVGALGADPVARVALTSGEGPVLVVPVPSSRASVRRRGDAVLHTLVSRALACAAYPPHEVLLAPVLRLRRRVADQAGLSRPSRAANLDHAMETRPSWRSTVPGACCLLADDVLTTGATLTEAARALHAAGARHVVAATVAATARREPHAG